MASASSRGKQAARLLEFYSRHDPSKSLEQIERIIDELRGRALAGQQATLALGIALGAPLGAPWDGPDALRAAAKSEREEQEAMGSN